MYIKFWKSLAEIRISCYWERGRHVSASANLRANEATDFSSAPQCGFPSSTSEVSPMRIFGYNITFFR